MQEGWKAGNITVDLTPPVAWADERLGRSAAFQLNGWVPLTPMITRYDDVGDPRYLDFVRALALDWLAQHPADSATEFAWYDMAIGYRAHRLGWLLDACLRDPRCSDEDVAALLAGARLHAQALERSEMMAWHSNHGLYMAIGQLALARRLPDVPDVARMLPQARDRLRGMVDRQFAADGVHVEHSPGYHVAALRSLQAISESGLAEDPELDARLLRAENAFAWLVRPDGRTPAIGDTLPVRVAADGADGEYHDPAAQWVASDGRAGAPPAERVRAFTDGGYAFARTWTGHDDSYLTLAAGFHSRVHKHADDGAITWFERGGEIVIDAGRYGYRGRTEPGSALAKAGYWYADPARIHVESTHAHATVELGERSWPRVGVKPYGSAIVEAHDADGCLLLRASIPHDGVRHHRVVVLRPGAWLLVADDLELDEAGPAAAQRFLFAGDLELDDGPVPALRRGGWTDALWMVPLDGAVPLRPQRGVHEPRMSGWCSPGEGVLEPAWALGVGRAAEEAASFTTLLAFGSAPPAGSSSTAAGVLTCTWTQDGVRHVLDVPRREGAPSYRVAGTTGSAT